MPEYILSWDTFNTFHKLTGHLTDAANEIEELDPLSQGAISERLEKETGITIWKLRDACDALCRIKREEYQKAVDWEEKHLKKNDQTGETTA